MATSNPYARSVALIFAADNPAQANVLIGNDFRPRLTDYGTIRMLDTQALDHTPFPSSEGDIQYIAPELLDPATFGLSDRNPAKKGDIYAFGMVSYQVSSAVGLTSGAQEINGFDQGHHNATTVLWDQGPDEHT